MKKMYIAVIDEAPDYMVPTLVAHSILNAHEFFTSPGRSHEQLEWYNDWHRRSFRKVVLKVNHREFEKIRNTLTCWAGHENTICNGAATCLVVEPVESDNVPNVLKFAKMWKPAEPEFLCDNAIADNLPLAVQAMIDNVPDSVDRSALSIVHNYSEFIAAIRVGYFRVRAGDTLSEIGMYTGTDWRELARINNLKNPDLIFPGQLIKLR